MNIIIVGAGNVGKELISQLSNEGHDIIVVDNDAKCLEDVVNTYDVMGILGNGASSDVLEEAKVNSAELFIACTSQDEVNILCCMVAKKLGASDTIARIRTPEYFTLFKGKELGLNMMVNPEYETALEISRTLRFSSAIKIEPFSHGRVTMVAVKATDTNGMNNVELKNLRTVFKTKILVCAVERNGKVHIPTGNFTLLSGDIVYLTASAESISEFFKEISDTKVSKRAMIVGGSRIAYYLAEELVKQGVKVKIVEQDADRCKELSEDLDKVDIIQGDGTDQELLLDEGVARTDAFIALCGHDEQNIILSIFAKNKKIKKVICKTDKSSYYQMLQESGIDSVVSTRTTTANQIVRYARAKQNSDGGVVSKIYRIVNEQAEAVEYTVSSDFGKLNTPIKDIKLARNVIIATIIRQNEIIIPDGNAELHEGDSVIVVTNSKASYDDLNDILE